MINTQVESLDQIDQPSEGSSDSDDSFQTDESKSKPKLFFGKFVILLC